VDRSIQDGYVQAIRLAEKFIYIENQYFLGSSQFWLGDNKMEDCDNLIADEIARKIEEKIASNQDFVAYILKPLHPEGVPGDEAIQEILHWQTLTQGMMFKRVADAIKKAGIHNLPQII